MSIRVGHGYDSHRFAPGGPLRLGGITIPANVGLVGHSDGDAVAHAIIDAMLGAAGAGSIGALFPDSDPTNLGRDSLDMLRRVAHVVRTRGWVVSFVDATVITERPAIAPHSEAMCRSLASAMGIAIESVSVKGKSNEGMGWIGRGEGLACVAIATLEQGG
ncbi:MAG TPA: 2-C-methyl-D-erythritol 2,4-cyclodiphosphate synthase [Gemmatimonadaceae bacterium]|nr:2-C-methyl-D-erythritol 2,4-cyclodiphosphate synthase [Gemmatimonadaceae bacterium]